MDVRVIEAPGELAGLKGEWDELLARSRQNTPFLSHGWLESWCTEYSEPGDALHVACCRDGSTGALVGVLPAYIRRTALPVPTARLRYIADEHVGSSRLGCIADPEAEAEVFDALAEHVLGIADSWDVLELRRMEEDSPFRERLVSRFGDAGLTVETRPAGTCPVVPLPGDWEAYLATLSHRLRATVRHSRRNVDALGDVRVEWVRDPAELDHALSDAASMYEGVISRSYRRPYEASERSRRFMSAVARDFASRDWLRLVFLTIDGRRVAFVHQFFSGPTMFAYQTGFDRAWAEHRVGMVLFSHAIEGAIADGCTSYDFLPGLDHYKSRWGATRFVELADVRAYGRSLAGRTCGVWDAGVREAKSTAKQVSPQVAARLSKVAAWRRVKRL